MGFGVRNRARGPVVPRDAVRAARRPGTAAWASALHATGRKPAGRRPGGPAVPGPDDPPRHRRSTPGGMCTDSAQPISNGAVRAGSGWCPSPCAASWARSAALRTTCRCCRRSCGRSRSRRSPADRRTGTGRLAELVEAIDRELLGLRTRPADHAFLRRDGRRGFALRGRPRRASLGYGYAAPSGRLGPVAALDASSAALLGHLSASAAAGRGRDLGARCGGTVPCARCCGPGSGSTGSRLCLLGRARLRSTLRAGLVALL